MQQARASTTAKGFRDEPLGGIRKDDADVIEQRAPERVTASHCESPDKRNGMVDARTTTQQLQVLDEYKEHAHNAENLIITYVLEEFVRVP